MATPGLETKSHSDFVKKLRILASLRRASLVLPESYRLSITEGRCHLQLALGRPGAVVQLHRDNSRNVKSYTSGRRDGRKYRSYVCLHEGLLADANS